MRGLRPGDDLSDGAMTVGYDYNCANKGTSNPCTADEKVGTWPIDFWYESAYVPSLEMVRHQMRSARKTGLRNGEA